MITFELPRFSIALALAASVVACNPLTGADDVDTDNDDDEVPADDDNNQTAREAPATPAFGCAYPIGDNMGVGVQQVVPQYLKWQGFAPGEETSREVSVGEVFDCDGSRSINGHGVNAILFDTSQFG